MKPISIALAISLFLPSLALAEDYSAIPQMMRRAFDWQMAALPTEVTGKGDTDQNWVRATFFDGVMAAYDLTHDPRYLDAMLKIGQQNHWAFQSGKSRFRHADAMAIGQLYCELYQIKKDPVMIAAMRDRWDQIMAQPMRGRQDWYWCDSLFMAPPALARLSAVTGDRKYLDFMDHQYWDTVNFLYDKSQHLFFRDATFFDKKESNGQPIFWSRGNGWVIAGLARILQFMPADYPDRPRFVRLFTDMANRLAQLQQPDGFWRASLLDPNSIPGGETSGTGLNCYALAWGINAGILPRDKFQPLVDRAWSALASVQDPSGKIGWTQSVGKAPAAVHK
ncbi:MAG TPA: glycoside hydrolase family 88 protein, partial [Tepidisphaeraceae bacterium]|nr:glycoside hydrolase family 88 protein [Tepidisphaeraceae bacterium]